MADHVTGRKRRKVVFDRDDDSASDGKSVSVDESDIDALSDEEGEEGADGDVKELKVLARTKQKKKKSEQEEEGVDNSGGHSSVSVSGLFDSEAIEDNTNVDFDEDYHGIESEEDQTSENGSGGLIDNEAVEDNSHLEFEEDYSGADSEEEEDGEGSTDEEVGDSDSEADASDDDESEFGSFVVEDDKVVYASEDDGLDQLDQVAEMVSRRKRGARFLEDNSMEGEEPEKIEQGSPHKAGTSTTLPKCTGKIGHHRSRQTATDKASKPLRNQQGDSQPSLHPARRKRGACFMDHTDSSSDDCAAEEGMNESKEDGWDEGVSHSSNEELTSEMDEGEEGSSSEGNKEAEEQEEEEEEEKGENGEKESTANEEDNLDSGAGALQWKSDLATRAASSFLHRQQKKIDLQKLIYDPDHSTHQQRGKNTVKDREEGEDIGGIFRPRGTSTDVQHTQDVTRKSCVVTHDWSREDLIASMKDLMVTGRWGEEDAQMLLQQDQDLYGDFEDLEKGERHSAEERHVGGASSDDGEGPQSLLEKKRQLKEEFDKEYDDKEGGEKDYFSELKDSYSRQAEMNRQEFEGIDESLRLQLEGAKVGSYVRIETKGMPCEFVENLDPHQPIIVGGLLPGETRLGYVTVRIKRHRWYKRILKSSDPLILSLGWRRFQTLPVYFKREDNLRQRYLKYTPEHLHCNATLYGPLTTPGTGFIGIQTVSESGVSVGHNLLYRMRRMA